MSGVNEIREVETGRPAVGIEVHEEYRVEAAQRVGRRLSEVHAEKEERDG